MLPELLTKILTLLFGYVMPAHECFKSIERPSMRIDELRFWCQYWIVVSLLFIFDEIVDALTSRLSPVATLYVLRIPMYYELKLAFIVYLWHRRTRDKHNIKGWFLAMRETSIRLMIFVVFYTKNFTKKGRDFCLELRDYLTSEAPGGSQVRVEAYAPPVEFDLHAPSQTPGSSQDRVAMRKMAERIKFQYQCDYPTVLAELSSPLARLEEARGHEKQDFSRISEARRYYMKMKKQATIATQRSARDMMPHRCRSESPRLWGMGTYENKVHNFVESVRPCDSLLGLWGMRGVGKSALLRLVRDYWADDTSFDHVLFVGVGTGGLTVNNAQHAIATGIGLDFPMISSLDEQSLAKVILRHFEDRDERVLLLLDNVAEPFDLWDLERRGHRIIYATRSQSVCAEMLHAVDNTIEIQCLGEDDAWNLFKEKVGVGIIDAHPQVHQLARKMVAECRGLPLALCVIGRAMSSKRDIREWRNAYDLLKAKHSWTQENEGYSCLDILETELKDSFLVTSLWPKDGSIPKERSSL